MANTPDSFHLLEVEHVDVDVVLIVVVVVVLLLAADADQQNRDPRRPRAPSSETPR